MNFKVSFGSTLNQRSFSSFLCVGRTTNVKTAKLAVLGVVVVLSGCAGLKEAFYQPKLQVTQATPAKVNLGAARKITIVQIGQARAALKEKLVSELLKQGRTGGVFQVADRSEEGIAVTLAGRVATVSVPPGGGEVFLKADFIESGSESVTKTVTEKTPQGAAVQKQVNVYKGNVLIGFTAVNAKGKALVADAQIDGSAENAAKDAAFDGAIANAVSKFYAAITPMSATRELVFDKSDLAQRPILDSAAAGNVPQATEQIRAYLNANPANATAMFNLGVLLEAGKKYQEAVEMYGKAAAAAPTKADYSAAKIAATTALANQQALAE